MASQAQIQQKKIDEYAKLPGHDPNVLAHMKRIQDYASTVDRKDRRWRRKRLY